MEIVMAIEDFVPVYFFYKAGIILRNNLESKMSNVIFNIFSLGLLIMFTSGFLKATHKLLLNSKICDLKIITKMFFGVLTFSSFLCGFSIVAMLSTNLNKELNMLYLIIPVITLFILMSKKVVYIFLNVIGFGAMCIGMCIISINANNAIAGIFYILCFFLMMGMGFLSSKVNSSKMNWIEQGVNTLGQGSLYLATYLLYKDNTQ